MQNLAQAKEHMDQGVILWVYPEGTRSKCGKLGRFKKGGFHLAMNTDALIVPVHIAGTDKALPAKKAGLKLGVSLKVSVGEPIDASQYSVDEKDRLCDDVRDAIKALAKSR